MLDRRVAGAAATSAGAAITLLGTFVTWLRSGASRRSSYELFDLVDRLGFSPDGVVGWALRCWPLVPLLLVLTTVLQWWPLRATRHRLVRRSLPIVTAAYAGGTASAVWLAPEAGLFRVGWGPAVTIGGSLLLVGGQLVQAVGRRGIGGTTLEPSGSPVDDPSIVDR